MSLWWYQDHRELQASLLLFSLPKQQHEMGNKIICPEQCEHRSRWALCQAHVAASLLNSWPENIHEPLIQWPQQQSHLISLSYQYVSLAPWWQKGPKTSLEKHSTFSNSTNTSSQSCSLLFQAVFSGSKENSLSPITFCKFQGSQLLEAPRRRYPSLKKLPKSCLATNVCS